MGIKSWLKAMLAVSALALSAPVRAFEPIDFGVQPWNPCFPVFGDGPLTNLGEGGAAWTNASAHVAWALAIPLGARALWGREDNRTGRRAMWIAGGTWIALSVFQEAFFHAPPNPGPAYASEVRTDLISRILPTVVVLVWDLATGDDVKLTPPVVSDRVAMAWGRP